MSVALAEQLKRIIIPAEMQRPKSEGPAATNSVNIVVFDPIRGANSIGRDRGLKVQSLVLKTEIDGKVTTDGARSILPVSCPMDICEDPKARANK